MEHGPSMKETYSEDDVTLRLYFDDISDGIKPKKCSGA